jgi:hypothetical protein
MGLTYLLPKICLDNLRFRFCLTCLLKQKYVLCSYYFFLVIMLVPEILYQLIVTLWELHYKQNKNNMNNLDCVHTIF